MNFGRNNPSCALRIFRPRQASPNTTLFKYNLINKDECLFLFVCMGLIKIHISKPIGTEICTHIPLGLEEVVGYAWTQNS